MNRLNIFLIGFMLICGFVSFVNVVDATDEREIFRPAAVAEQLPYQVAPPSCNPMDPRCY